METEPLKVEAQPQPETEKKVVKKIIKKTPNETAQKQETTTTAPKQPATAPKQPAGAERPKPSIKANLFEKKPGSTNAISGRKESKPITTFGNDIFKDRLSIFEKSKQNTNTVTSKEDPGPKKLDPSKFGNFSATKDSNPSSSSGGAPVGVSNGIQARLNAYLENAKSRSKTVSHMDPLLNKIKEKNGNEEEVKGDKEEEDEIKNNNSGLDISADNDEIKDDLEDELGGEKEEDKVKIEEEPKKEDEDIKESSELEKNEDEIEDV